MAGNYERTPEIKNKNRMSNLGKRIGTSWGRHTEEAKKRMSIIRKAKNIPSFWKGKKIPESTKEKIRISRMGKPTIWGEKHPNWKGGIAPEVEKIRDSIEYSLWRNSVFARDNFTCQECGERGGYLEAHHIKSFSVYIELRFAIDNG